MTMNKKYVLGMMAVIAVLMTMSIPSANAVLYDIYTDKPLEISEEGKIFIVIYIVHLEEYASNSPFEADALNEHVKDYFTP